MNLVIEPKTFSNQAERRRSRRHALCLDAEAAIADEALPVQLHELSRSGFLMECKGALAAGEQFEIRLDGSGAYRARAIWTCGALIGCEFQHALSPSEGSAALLKARPGKTAENPAWWIDEDRPEAVDSDLLVQPSGRSGRRVAVIVGLSIGLWVAVAVAAAVFLI